MDEINSFRPSEQFPGLNCNISQHSARISANINIILVITNSLHTSRPAEEYFILTISTHHDPRIQNMKRMEISGKRLVGNIKFTPHGTQRHHWPKICSQCSDPGPAPTLTKLLSCVKQFRAQVSMCESMLIVWGLLFC